MAETDWTRFRVESISWPTFLKRNLIHAELLTRVAGRAKGAVLEVGVGSGAQSAALSRVTPFVVSIDNDSRILSASTPNLRRYGRGVRLVSADAFALPFAPQSFGVAVSQGLFEHFEDDAIRNLVREQLRVCRSVVFSVPSDHYPRQDVGNERLMTPAQWRSILEPLLDETRHRLDVRYARFDPEAWKYSLLERRLLGGFSVLVTIDPRRAD
jgi:ubiquinone/menaquinone biosynthesis C-methylase UbiE